MSLCVGCGLAEGSFQCPLCQAAELDGGFYCSQPCFAKNFVAHRDEVHKGGVVRAKRGRKSAGDEDATAAAAASLSATEKTSKAKTKLKELAAGTAKAPQPKASDEQPSTADLAALPDDVADAFSDEETEEVFRAALAKELAKRKELPVWPVWPSAAATGDAVVFATTAAKPAAGRAVLVVNPDDANWSRSEVAIASDDVEEHAHAACLFAIQTAANWTAARSGSNGGGHAVIVAGSATTAHAVAWAARCRGIACVPFAAMDANALNRSPSRIVADFLPEQRRIAVVAYPSLLGSPAGGVDIAAGKVSAWLAATGEGIVGANKAARSGLLIVLPDVGPEVDPEDLQSLTAASVFVRKASEAHATASATPAKHVAASPASAKKSGKAAVHVEGTATSSSSSSNGGVPVVPPLVGAPRLVAKDQQPAHAHYDPNVSVQLCVRGDIINATAKIARLYTECKSFSEDVLASALMADWGSPSVVHAHHKLAVLLRLLVDSSVKMATSTRVRDDASLASIAARCVVRAAKHLAPISADLVAAAGSPCPFIFLDATVAYVFGKVPRSAIDELLDVWGLKDLGVVSTLGHEDRMRTVALHRLRSLYQPQLGVTQASFAGVLHHCIADAAIRHSMSVRDVRAATLWDYAAAPFGDLATFLVAAQLVHRAEDLTSASGFTKEGKKTTKTQRNKKVITDLSFVHDGQAVQQHPTQKCGKLKRLEWPLRAARQRRKDLMLRAALDEVLMAMPSSSKVPMYLGDIGNLIGKWTTFNARFYGYLPPTLQQFIEAYPEEFRIIGNVVTRVKDSKTQQIKIRYHEDERGDDSDDDDILGQKPRKQLRSEQNKKRVSLADIHTRRGLQNAEKKLLGMKNMTKRSAKKKLKSLRNQARYNRNHRPLDQSAKVPGYSKPKPKALKGRGRKANIRTTKRKGA